MNLTTIGDIRETFAYFAMAFVAAIFLVLQMISLTVCVNFYVKFYSIILWKIFLRCEKIKQSIFKTTYQIMVFLHALDIAQLFTWSFAIFMGVSGFYYEPYTELVRIFCANDRINANFKELSIEIIISSSLSVAFSLDFTFNTDE